MSLGVFRVPAFLRSPGFSKIPVHLRPSGHHQVLGDSRSCRTPSLPRPRLKGNEGLYFCVTWPWPSSSFQLRIISLHLFTKAHNQSYSISLSSRSRMSTRCTHWECCPRRWCAPPRIAQVSQWPSRSGPDRESWRRDQGDVSRWISRQRRVICKICRQVEALVPKQFQFSLKYRSHFYVRVALRTCFVPCHDERISKIGIGFKVFLQLTFDFLLNTDGSTHFLSASDRANNPSLLG